MGVIHFSLTYSPYLRFITRSPRNAENAATIIDTIISFFPILWYRQQPTFLCTLLQERRVNAEVKLAEGCHVINDLQNKPK